MVNHTPIFFSFLRKVFIAIPLVLILPGLGYGVNGVFMAEPVSDVIGGLASFITMYLTLYRKLPDEDMQAGKIISEKTA